VPLRDLIERPREVEDAGPVLEVPRRGHAIAVFEQCRVVLSQHGADLLFGPDVEAPLLAFAVGVLGGIERAVRAREIARDVREHVTRGRGVLGAAGDGVALEVGVRDLRLVVQHLLEMRHEPLAIRRIAVESAAELIADPARSHRVELRFRHRARRGMARRIAQPPAPQEIEVHDRGKLRRSSESAVHGVERGGKRIRAIRRERRDRRSLGLRSIDRCQRGEQLVAGLLELGAALDPRFVHAREQLDQPRPPGHGVRRKVRPAIERLEIGGEKRVQRPAAAEPHRLHRRHVDPIDVGALLAVDLDRHEIAVQQFGDRIVLERFALHDVAPVAGRVADREEDRLVLAPRARERFLAPRIPVHGIHRVLQQVGALLAAQAIRPARHVRGVGHRAPRSGRRPCGVQLSRLREGEGREAREHRDRERAPARAPNGALGAGSHGERG